MVDSAVVVINGNGEMRNRETYKQISGEYQKMVGFVRSRLRDSADRDAEDVVQDVLTSVVDRMNVAAPLEDITAYIYRGLRNRIIDMFRKRRDIVSMDEPITDDTTLKDLLSDLTHSPEHQFTAKEAAKQLYAAIDTLTDDEKEIVIAVEIEGYTFSELSEQWDISINTLLSRKARAMTKLKQLLNVEEVPNGVSKL